MTSFSKVSVPGSRPPTESKQQVRASEFLQKIDTRKGKTCCFFDGNKAWASECRRLDIMYRSVSHQDHEYAKRISTTPGQLSNWGGTQVMDRWWLSLKTFVPPTSNRKCRVGGASALHPNMALRLYQWVWRVHDLRGKSPREILMSLSNLF